MWPEDLSYEAEKVVWFLRHRRPPFSVNIMPATADRLRHRPKYAEGDMRSFGDLTTAIICGPKV